MKISVFIENKKEMVIYDETGFREKSVFCRLVRKKRCL
jgi:hypothetical protein